MMDTLHDFFVFTKGIEYLIAVSFLILFPVFWVLIHKRKRAPETARAPEFAPDRVPAGAFLGPGHAWLHLEGSGAVRVGAGGLPVALLGGLDRAEIKPPGTEVKRGEPVAVLHRGKRTLTLPAPVSGTIARVNPEIEADPQQVTRDPFAGWLYKVLPQGLDGAVKQMFVAEEAVGWMRGELQRLRDAVTGLSSPSPMPSLPDGGLPVAGLATSLPDQAWDQLSEQFFTLTPSREAD